MRTLPYPDPGRPDLRSPGRLLWWTGRQQWRAQLSGMTWGVLWFVAQALMPVTIGAAIDQGVVARDGGALLRWAGVALALAVAVAICGTMRHRSAVASWMQAAFRMIQLLGDHTASTGAALPQQVPTGEVVATVASDAQHVGGAYDTFARFSGGVVAYVLVAVILLRISVPLGLLVLVGVPIVTAALGGLIAPLHHRQAEQREQVGRLTTLGADTVTGLRVLRGIGGEEIFARRYAEQSRRVCEQGIRVGAVQSLLESAQVLLPGVFVVLITWIGARFAIEGRISAGQLVAAYGYAAFLVGPLSTTVEMADRTTRAYVGARRIIRVLTVEPGVREPLVTAVPPPAGSMLLDPESGLAVEPGRLTAVVSAYPEESAALADRLGRFGERDAARAVRLGGVPLAALPAGRGPAAGPGQRDRAAAVHRRAARGAARAGRRGRHRRADLGRGRGGERGRRRRRPARTGWTAGSRSAAARCPAASASGWPWPGPCCATPRRSCSSSRPARSTRTPRPGSASGCGPPGPAGRPSS